GPCAGVVDHARRRDRELGDGGGDRAGQEAERLGEDDVLQADRPIDPEGGRGELQGARLIAEPDGEALLAPADATELVDEVHVPGGPPELAVGGGPKPDVFLHGYDRPDRLVLGGPKLLTRQVPCRLGGPRLAERRRPQQAADVVGPERRRVHGEHRSRAYRPISAPSAGAAVSAAPAPPCRPSGGGYRPLVDPTSGEW